MVINPNNYKTILITGASAGIGEAVAYKFASEGYDLILLARRKDKLSELQECLHQEFGVNVNTFGVDVRDNQALEELFRTHRPIFEKTDVLINNAGLAAGMSKIQDGDLLNWERMIDTNIKGLLYISRQVLPILVKKASGLVVNVASIAGREVYPNGNVYCATKSAVKTLSQSMAIDLNGTGVKVSNIDPGMVETEFSLVRFDWNKEKAEQVYRGFTPLSGKDVAESIFWVASQPKHVNIQDMLIMPSAQASTTITSRK